MLSFRTGMTLLHLGLSKIYFSFNASVVFCLQSSLKPTIVLSYALSDELQLRLFLSHSFILPREKFSATVPPTSNWMLLDEKELRGGGGGSRTNVFEGNRQKWGAWRPGQHLPMTPPKNQDSKVKINIWVQYFHHLFLWLCWVLVASGLNCFTASEILIPYGCCCCCCCSVTSDSLQTHGLQHLRLPCLPLSPEVCSNSGPLSRWHHPTICPFLLFLPSIFTRIRIFFSELTLHTKWPKYWSCSFTISPFNE